MPRPKRFTSAFGKYTQQSYGWSQYQYYYPSSGWGSWIGSQTPSKRNPILTSVRLHPVVSNFVDPTNWGVVAERGKCHAYDYYSNNGSARYHWRGDNDHLVMGFPTLTGAGIGSVESSATTVAVSLPYGISEAASNAARNGLSDTNVNVGVLLGELKESIGLLGDIYTRVFRSLRHARKGRWRRAIEALNGGSLGSSAHVAENYASYIWGILPLINDAYGIQQQMKDGFRSRGSKFRSVGFKSHTVSPRSFWSGFNSDSHRPRGNARCFSRVVYDVSIESEVLSALSQLGLTNPVAVAWELMPLSFVIDWFLPIGDFLSAILAPLGTSFLSGFEDKVIEVNVSCEFCRYGFSQYQGGTVQSCDWQYFAFERRTLEWIQPPKLYLGSGLNNSVSKVISTVALIKLRTR